MFGVRRLGPVVSVIALLLLGVGVMSCGPTNDGTTAGSAAASNTPTSTVVTSTTVPGSTGPATATTQRTITVGGVGIVTVVPDTVKIQLGATITNASVTTALNDVDQRMTAIINVLHSNGIADKDIQTSTFSVMAQYDYSSGRNTVTGYTVTHMVRFSASPTDKAGVIISAAVDAGANQIYDISFTTADPSSAKQKARDNAISDALLRAQQFAQAAGMQVGLPISISEGTLVSPVTNKTTVAGAGSGAVVEAGQQDIEVDVTVTYDLK